LFNILHTHRILPHTFLRYRSGYHVRLFDSVGCRLLRWCVVGPIYDLFLFAYRLFTFAIIVHYVTLFVCSFVHVYVLGCTARYSDSFCSTLPDLFVPCCAFLTLPVAIIPGFLDRLVLRSFGSVSSVLPFFAFTYTPFATTTHFTHHHTHTHHHVVHYTRYHTTVLFTHYTHFIGFPTHRHTFLHCFFHVFTLQFIALRLVICCWLFYTTFAVCVAV